MTILISVWLSSAMALLASRSYLKWRNCRGRKSLASNESPLTSIIECHLPNYSDDLTSQVTLNTPKLTEDDFERTLQNIELTEEC